MKKLSAKKFLLLFHITTSLFDFIFAYPIYNVFFSKNGLSTLDISFLLGIWAFSAIIFEIPSGAIGDYLGERFCLIIAPLIKSLCFLIWYFAERNFSSFAFGFLMWAIGSSLVSGSKESLLFRSLKNHNSENIYEKVLSVNKMFFFISLAISSALGGLIAQVRMDIAIIASILPLVLSSFLAFSLKIDSGKNQHNGKEKINYAEHIKIAFSEFRENNLFRTLLFCMFGISLFGALEEYSQLLLDEYKLSSFAMGIFGSLWATANVLVSYLHSRFSFKKPHLFLAYSSLILISIGIIRNPFMSIIMIFPFGLGIPVEIFFNSEIQKSIKSESRATITSLSSLFYELSGIIYTIAFGLVGKLFGVQAIFLSAGLFVGIFWIVLEHLRILNPTKT